MLQIHRLQRHCVLISSHNEDKLNQFYKNDSYDKNNDRSYESALHLFSPKPSLSAHILYIRRERVGLNHINLAARNGCPNTFK